MCEPPSEPVDQAGFAEFFLEDWPHGYGLGHAEDLDFEASIEAFLEGVEAFVKQNSDRADKEKHSTQESMEAEREARMKAEESLQAERDAAKRDARVAEAAEDRLKDEKKAER